MERGVEIKVLAGIGYELPGHMLGEKSEDSEVQKVTPPTPEQQQEQRVERLAQDAGNVICGDCLHIVPCVHVGVRSDGSRYTRGH